MAVAINLADEDNNLEEVRTIVKELYSEEKRETHYKAFKTIFFDEKMIIDDIDFDDEALKKFGSTMFDLEEIGPIKSMLKEMQERESAESHSGLVNVVTYIFTGKDKEEAKVAVREARLNHNSFDFFLHIDSE